MAKFLENQINNDSDDIDLKRAFYIISKNKFFILSITTIFTFGGIVYSLLKQPIWEGNFLIRRSSYTYKTDKYCWNEWEF